MSKVSRRVIGSAVTICLWIGGLAPLAHAHGGMVGPEELGPPLTISFCLAFASYWLVILWPASKSEREDPSAKTANIQARKPAGLRTHRADTSRQHPMRLVKKVTSNDSSGTGER